MSPERVQSIIKVDDFMTRSIDPSTNDAQQKSRVDVQMYMNVFEPN